MACQPWRNRPDDAKRKAAIIAALKASRTRDEAARKLGMGVGALDSAGRRYGIPIGATLGLGSNSAPDAPPAPPAPATPPWKGYSPRPGWEQPGKTAKASSSRAEAKRVAVIPDVHVPYHDRKAWATALGIVKEWKPDRVVVIGDFLDMESVSRHPKTKPDLVRLSAEYYEANVLLDELQAATPNATWLFIEGNHENRAVKWCNEFGNMDGMLDVPSSLYMKRGDDYHRNTTQLRGMEWIGLERQPYVIESVAYLHGVFENAHHAYAHAAQLAPALGVREIVYGHLHSIQSATGPALPGRAGPRATCCGFLGDATQPVFRFYCKGRPKPWETGLLLQEVADGLVSNHPVRIVAGRALFGGKVLAA